MNTRLAGAQLGRKATTPGHRWWPLLALLAVAVLLVASAGCGGTSPETQSPPLQPTETATATPCPSHPPTFVPTPSPTSTATPLPTSTPVPTPSPSPTATPTALPIPLSPRERAALEAIADEVEQIRGLDSNAPLALAFMTPEEMHGWLIEQLAQEYSPEEAGRDARLYVALELLPPETDLYALTLALYAEQIAGFYDNDRNQMTVIDDETGLDAMDKLTFAHEYTHDLQDQFLGLDNLQAYREAADSNEDTVRAITALVEGDAQTITMLYLLNHMDELDLSALETIETATFDAAPLILQEELTFPYLAGMTFVQTIRQQGGWDAVNALYDAPPQSTEQILHPAKYLAAEAPLAVSLPPLTGTLGAGWHLVKENTLGEFLLHHYLDVHLPGSVAGDASAGWGGDRFALYEQPSTGDTLLLLVTAWDDQAQAAEFASAYAAFAEDKHNSPATAQDPSATWWHSNNQATLLLTTGHHITILLGPDTETLQRVRQTVEKELPPNPNH